MPSESGLRPARKGSQMRLGRMEKKMETTIMGYILG